MNEKVIDMKKYTVLTIQCRACGTRHTAFDAGKNFHPCPKCGTSTAISWNTIIEIHHPNPDNTWAPKKSDPS